jgi:tetratricopeptide (TPR) repeat protein
VSVTDNRPTNGRAKLWRRFGLAAAVLIVVGLGWGAWHGWIRPAARAERLLAEAAALRTAGDNLKAGAAAAAAWELDPTLSQAALLAAECAAAEGDLPRALDYARRVDSADATDANVRLRAALLTAEVNHYWVYRLSEAEQAYRIALEIAPDDINANSGLAVLLGLCARRREAIPHVLRIVRAGEATDLLMLLARESGLINDRDALEQAHRAAPDDANPLIGFAWHAASEEQTGRAVELLEEAVRRQPGQTAAHVALGRQLTAAGRFDDLSRWDEQLPAGADEFPETWAVRAQWAEQLGDPAGAIRCWLEAARRAPEIKTANVRLARLLAEAGAQELSERFAAHLSRLQELDMTQDRVLFSSNRHNSVQPLLELARSYETAGRLWEACGWCRLAVDSDPSDEDARRLLAELRQQAAGLPLRLTADTANVALSVDFSAYPLPRWRDAADRPVAAATATDDQSSALSFQDDAETAGLRFRYYPGTDDPSSKRMFAFTGGGVGVLDFDLDGFPDVYFTQGRTWPPGAETGEHRDRLFRNLGGEAFADVTGPAGVEAVGFGQGVAVGDFDGDGFPDLYVANIGANQLWMNNGDGTFTNVTDEAGVGGREWTTSVVVADFDGDGLPDLYDVNYLKGDDLFERICRHPDGAPKLCMPFDFDAEPDRLWRNGGNGGFSDATADVLSTTPAGKGLGAAVWDADGSGRLSLFVANDTTPNFFFTPDSTGEGPVRFHERGIPAGLAFNEDGKAEGCMGIAVGDADGNGRFDVFVTNFLAESNTLYANASAGYYEDRTRAAGLHAPSVNVLGFGTQFLDVNLDGRLELFVSNGHIDDLRPYGRPYEMPAQLFRLRGRQFEQLDGAALGPYFRRHWLGRPVARIDWNRDGRDDLVVGHLGHEAALLTNTTSIAGRFLSLRLFGVRSNRDAIGTTVTARIGEQRIVRQLTAGDGYQASNERRLIFGIGSARQIDELVVHWPSGTRQTFHNVSAPLEAWLREGGTLYAAPGFQNKPDGQGEF